MTTNVGLQRTAHVRALCAALALALGTTGAQASAVADGPPPEARFAHGRSATSARNAQPAGASGVVTTCEDNDEPGSLRYELENASQYEVSLDSLTCSRIVLTRGEIVIANDWIALHGIGNARVRIEAAPDARVFRHTGSGGLDLSGVEIVGGSVHTLDEDAEGACILSAGPVYLLASSVHGCRAVSDHGEARGGAIAASFVTGMLTEIRGSSVTGFSARGGGAFGRYGIDAYDFMQFTDNTATATGTGATAVAVGGGVASGALFKGSDATFSGNLARAEQGIARGGGVFVDGFAQLYGCTISGNAAESPASAGGGLSVEGNWTMIGSLLADNTAAGASALDARADGDYPLLLSNSTVSGNISTDGAAAVAISGTAAIYNSTIAFNVAHDTIAGIDVDGDALIESSIVADNASFGGEDVDLAVSGALTGSHDLIVSSQSPLPADTLRGDPRLLPLADNGGYTHTHAIAADSPAIDAGSNLQRSRYDQRGWAPYDRVNNGHADIGAYERDVAGELFHDSFESPPGIDGAAPPAG